MTFRDRISEGYSAISRDLRRFVNNTSTDLINMDPSTPPHLYRFVPATKDGWGDWILKRTLTSFHDCNRGLPHPLVPCHSIYVTIRAELRDFFSILFSSF